MHVPEDIMYLPYKIMPAGLRTAGGAQAAFGTALRWGTKVEQHLLNLVRFRSGKGHRRFW